MATPGFLEDYGLGKTGHKDGQRLVFAPLQMSKQSKTIYALRMIAIFRRKVGRARHLDACERACVFIVVVSTVSGRPSPSCC